MLLESIFMALASVMPQQDATLLFAGDAMQHARQLEVARTADGRYDYSGCFADIEPIVAEADYAVVNLETPVGDRNFSGYPCFNAPVSYAGALRDAGFDMMLTANNHTLDRRDAGLRRTVAVLDSLGLDHIGTYPGPAARKRAVPYIRDIKGFRVGFLNYTYGTNGISPRDSVVVDVIDRNAIRGDIKATRSAGAEIVVVAIHWGIEYVLYPPESVRRLADFLCHEDVDMVIGGHPHVIQPMEIRHNATTGRDVLLVYSMGNLISNMRTRDTRGGAMVRATIGRDSTGRARVESAEYIPHFTVPGTSPRDNFRVVALPEGTPVDSVIPAAWRPQARAWLNSAIPVFNRHNRGVPRAKTSASKR